MRLFQLPLQGLSWGHNVCYHFSALNTHYHNRSNNNNTIEATWVTAWIIPDWHQSYSPLSHPSPSTGALWIAEVGLAGRRGLFFCWIFSLSSSNPLPGVFWYWSFFLIFSRRFLLAASCFFLRFEFGIASTRSLPFFFEFGGNQLVFDQSDRGGVLYLELPSSALLFESIFTVVFVKGSR